MQKIETILEENHHRLSHLEKENKDLEDKLTNVTYYISNSYYFIDKIY